MTRVFFCFVCCMCLFQVNAQFAFNFSDSIAVLQDGQPVQMPWAGGLNTPQFAPLDYDYDGDLDLLVFDRSADQLRVFRQDQIGPDKRYTLDPIAHLYFPSDLRYRVTTFDYNADGKLDLFCYAIGGIRAYTNVGSAATGLSWQEYSPYLVSNYGGPTLNLYIAASDIPALVDVEGDGDMDILTYHISGEYLQYHQNQSQELYGHSDSLIFVLKNRCWGGYREDVTSNNVYLHDTSSYCNGGNVSNPELPKPTTPKAHSGSTVLALDLDQSGVLDLLIGDVAYGNVLKLLNGGTAPNTNSDIVSIDANFPSNTTPINIQLFAAAYHLDLDFDGVKDLVAAPNANNVSENENSAWRYKNLGSNQNPVFVFQEKDFLQHQMIEHGSGSIPVLHDLNQDGLLDLFVANFYAYKPNASKESRVAYYQNNGTPSAPQFVLIDEDWLGMASMGLGLRLVPCFGDLNNDNKPDLLIGQDNGQLRMVYNTGSSSLPQYSFPGSLLQDQNGQVINVQLFAAPQLFDLNNDGLLDLIVGSKNNSLSFYQNTGSLTSPVFTFVTNTLGGVDLSSTISPDGFGVPHFFSYQDTSYLLVGGYDGRLHFYDSLSTTSNFHERSADFLGLSTQIGAFASAFIANLDQDNHLDLVVGQDLGGLFLLEDQPGSSLAIPEEKAYLLKLYPNPFTDQFFIEWIGPDQLLSLTNLQGQVIAQVEVHAGEQLIDLACLPKGIYFLIDAQHRATRIVKL